MWCVGTGKRWSVGLSSVVFVSVCFLVNVSGRRLVGFNRETNLHRVN